jgi:alpha-beta hydrolase superfamily lysophospholipase
MRRLAWALAALMVFALAGSGLIAWRSWNYALSTLHPPRLPVPSPPPIGGLQSIEFREPAGLVLRGWWVPPRNRAAIILCHGHGANRAQLTFELTLLARHGYGVLAFDLPGHGTSDGQIVTWGDRERAALEAALDFVGRQPEVDSQRIAALGFSMGGSIVVEVAAIDPRLKAIAISGTYTALSDEFHQESGKWGPLSRIPALEAIEAAGVDPRRVRPVAEISKVAPRPVLLIDGTEDPAAPIDMEQRLFQAAGEPKTLWIVQGAHHGDYGEIDPSGYEEHLVALFDGALLQ